MVLQNQTKNHVCGNQFWNRKMIWEYFIFSGLPNKIIKKITYQRNIIKILEYRELVVEVSIRSPQWQLMLNNQNHWRSKHNSPVPWDQAWEPLSVPRPSLGPAVSTDWLSPSPRSAVLVAVATPLALFVLPLASPQSALVCPWIPVNSTDLVKGDYNI